MKQNTKIVELLTSAAMALPGLAVQAESAPLVAHADFGYGTYDESGARYDINVYQSKLTMPLTDKTALTVLTQRDLQTGASFIFAEPQSMVYFGEPVNVGNPSVVVPIVSGASIKDVRDSISLTGTYYFASSIMSVGYRYSTEDDYLSHSVYSEWAGLFNKKNSEFTIGLSYSNDHVRLPRGSNKRNPATHVPLVTGASLLESQGGSSEFDLLIGLRQDWSAKTTSLISGSFSKKRGYLGDPYKRTAIYGNAQARRPGSVFIPDTSAIGIPLNIAEGMTIDFDRRPGLRETYGAIGKVIHYFEQPNSAVHLQYQLAYNTWGMVSNTLEASYHQPFRSSWRVVPLIRYYTQTQADFYAYIFEATGEAPFPAKLLPIGLENSSDNRLSKFGTFNTQLGVVKRFVNDIELEGVAGVYASREWLHWGTPPEVSHPFNNYTATYFGLNVGIDFS